MTPCSICGHDAHPLDDPKFREITEHLRHAHELLDRAKANDERRTPEQIRACIEYIRKQKNENNRDLRLSAIDALEWALGQHDGDPFYSDGSDAG